MMLAASSASGSGQYLFARTKQASASCTLQYFHFHNLETLCAYFGPLQVLSIHEAALEVLDPGVLSLEETFNYNFNLNTKLLRKSSIVISIFLR